MVNILIKWLIQVVNKLYLYMIFFLEKIIMNETIVYLNIFKFILESHSFGKRNYFIKNLSDWIMEFPKSE